MSMNRLSEYFFDLEIDDLATATSLSRQAVKAVLLAQIQVRAFDQSKTMICEYMKAIEKRLRRPIQAHLEELAKRQFEYLEEVFAWMDNDLKITNVTGHTKAEVERHSKGRTVFVEQIISELRQEAFKSAQIELSLIHI